MIERNAMGRAAVAALLWIFIDERSASAQPAPSPAPSAAGSAPTADVTGTGGTAAQGEEAERSQEAKEEARRRFERALTFFDQQAWAAAAAEFLASRKLYPTRNATLNAAKSLSNLQRFDEALELYEALLREFPKLTPEDKAEAQGAIEQLRARVGTIEITGGAPGASILIDGRARGDYPPVTPLRVSAGPHMVRLFKDGYVPFEARVDVSAGQTQQVAAKLFVLTESGRLKVTEQGGRALNVLVDGLVMGQTPWEGTLSVGEHVVVLRGEGNLGTAPVSAPVKSQELTPLTLRAEELDAILRVDPTPAGANVVLDDVSLGRGSWEGALRSGPHRVEVRADGFVPVRRQVSLARGAQERLTIDLQRDEDAAIWKKPSKLTVEATTGLVLAPSFEGGVAGQCDGGCSMGPGIGALALVHGTYEMGSGLGVGLTLGYLMAYQGIDRRTATIAPVQNGTTPVAFAPTRGQAEDDLRLTGLVVGGNVGYWPWEKFPVHLRVGAGAVVGQVRDQRWLSVDEGATSPSAVLSPKPTEGTGDALYLYVDPEARMSFRLGEQLEFSAGVQALVLFALSTPRFNDTPVAVSVSHPTDAGEEPRPGLATYPDDELTGKRLVLFVPEVGLRYTF